MEYGIGLLLFLLVGGGILFFHKRHERKVQRRLVLRAGSDLTQTQTVRKSTTAADMKVLVVFDKVTLKHHKKEAHIVKHFDEPKTINLLDHSRKLPPLLTEFDEDEVTGGFYEWMRLGVVSDQCKVERDGEAFDMRIPSGDQTGLKLVRGFLVSEIGLSDFSIDFNVKKNLTRKSDGSYILKPALKLIDNLHPEGNDDVDHDFGEE